MGIKEILQRLSDNLSNLSQTIWESDEGDPSRAQTLGDVSEMIDDVLRDMKEEK